MPRVKMGAHQPKGELYRLFARIAAAMANPIAWNYSTYWRKVRAPWRNWRANRT